MSERVSIIEGQLVAGSRSQLANQNYLELETAEKVMSRVKTWANLILYFAGIPAAVALLALAIIFGKGAFDLREIATNTKDSVNSIVDQARSEATRANLTATDALNTSKQVSKDIQETRQKIGELRTQMDGLSSEVVGLSGRIKASREQLTSLTTSINSQSQEVARLSEHLKTVETKKNIDSVREQHPFLFGEHVAGWRKGWIDPKAKTADDIYVAFMLLENQYTFKQFSAESVAAVMQSLQDHRYTVLDSYVYLAARSGTAASGLGANFDPGSCGIQGTGLRGPPCILYFDEKMRGKASEVKQLISPAEAVPESSVKYVAPQGLTPSFRELLQLSGLDFVVVLGQDH
ncbi:MAG: methyl-accepting chemotaxis protein [Candidatus Sulfotelmatobacter sp.]